MNRFDLVIKNPDGSLYWSIGFETKGELNAWLKEERAKFYWKKDFVVEVTDNSEIIDAREAEARAADEARQQKETEVREAIKDALKKKPKTVAEAVALLEKICEHLGISVSQQLK